MEEENLGQSRIITKQHKNSLPGKQLPYTQQKYKVYDNSHKCKKFKSLPIKFMLIS